MKKNYKFSQNFFFLEYIDKTKMYTKFYEFLNFVEFFKTCLKIDYRAPVNCMQPSQLEMSSQLKS